MITLAYRLTPGGSAKYWEGWIRTGGVILRTRTTHKTADDAWNDAADLLIREWLR